MALTFNIYNPISISSVFSNRNRPYLSFSRPTTTTTTTVSATGKFKSRTGKFDSKNRRSTTTTTTKEDIEVEEKDTTSTPSSSSLVDDGYVLPKLPGDQPDFWEGPQWDALGFFVQYMWAFGVLFALVACGIAVATYNEGATDFRDTPAYKESIQSPDILEGPEASDTDIFESNPTEEAPSLE